MLQMGPMATPWWKLIRPLFSDKETLSFRSESMTITNKIANVFLPKARKQYSRNGFHGITLPEVNRNRYLPSKFEPKIRHVILIGIHGEGTKYAINIKM